MADAPQQVAPAEARTFVQGFVPDPKVVEGMDDKAVVEYHGRVIQAVDKFRPAQTGAWPDSWRETLAKGADGKPDAKVLERLGRFDSPTKVWESFRQFENRLSSGELKSVLPKDAKPEQIAAWRAENGIPEAPEKYDIKLKDGLVIGESDKAYIARFLGAAHGRNVSNEQASGMIEAYYDILEQQTQEAAKRDKEVAATTQATLRKEWGGDYERNMNIFHGALEGAPTGVKDKILGGRTPDGAPLSADPDVIRWLVQQQLEINPATTVIPGQTGQQLANSIENEIKSIEKTMKENRKAYNADEKMQARLRDLYTARDAAAAKGKPA